MANVLQTVTRTSDIAARVGGDEFAVLATDSDQHSTQRLVERLEQSLVESGVAASIGFCQRRSPKTLDDAWKEADLRMYANKSQRKRNAIVAPT